MRKASYRRRGASTDYGDDHVADTLRYGRLRGLGFPPAAIRLLLAAREGTAFSAAQGVALVIDPGLLGSGTPAGPLVERIAKLLAEVLKGHAQSGINLAKKAHGAGFPSGGRLG